VSQFGLLVIVPFIPVTGFIEGAGKHGEVPNNDGF
jgi:hypothetical protein